MTIRGLLVWLLTAVLVVAKLTGNLGWSWWAVTCPIWGAFAVFGFLIQLSYGIGDELGRKVDNG